MSVLDLTKGYQPRDNDAKPFARGEFVCNVEGLKSVEGDYGKSYVLEVSVVNVVHPKPDNEAVMTDKISIWYKTEEEKGAKRFRNDMFVSGLEKFLDMTGSEESLEASFVDVINKLVYVKAYTYKNKSGKESQSASLKSESMITPENSQPQL